jgi:hypothetical protein
LQSITPCRPLGRSDPNDAAAAPCATIEPTHRPGTSKPDSETHTHREHQLHYRPHGPRPWTQRLSPDGTRKKPIRSSQRSRLGRLAGKLSTGTTSASRGRCQHAEHFDRRPLLSTRRYDSRHRWTCHRRHCNDPVIRVAHPRRPPHPSNPRRTSIRRCCISFRRPGPALVPTTR